MVCGLPLAVASLVAEHGSRALGSSSCGSWPYLLCSMWNLPGAGIELKSPALAGRFLTTGPPEKSLLSHFESPSLRKTSLRTSSLVVQWLELCASSAGGPSSILGWGTKIPQAVQCGQKKKDLKKSWCVHSLHARTPPTHMRVHPSGLLLLPAVRAPLYHSVCPDQFSRDLHAVAPSPTTLPALEKRLICSDWITCQICTLSWPDVCSPLFPTFYGS